jgi:uncharacterized membrane protein
MTNTSTGLSENAASVLCYVLGWISGIVFLIIEPGHKLIKFHAFQSIIVFAVLTVVTTLFSLIPIIGDVISTLIGIVGFILWIVLMVLASQGKKYKLPWAGDLAEKWAG